MEKYSALKKITGLHKVNFHLKKRNPPMKSKRDVTLVLILLSIGLQTQYSGIGFSYLKFIQIN